MKLFTANVVSLNDLSGEAQLHTEGVHDCRIFDIEPDENNFGFATFDLYSDQFLFYMQVFCIRGDKGWCFSVIPGNETLKAWPAKHTFTNCQETLQIKCPNDTKLVGFLPDVSQYVNREPVVLTPLPAEVIAKTQRECFLEALSELCDQHKVVLEETQFVSDGWTLPIADITELV